VWLLVLSACHRELQRDEPLVAVTFDAGTALDLAPDREQALQSQAFYGDGLAWMPAIDALQEWLKELDPDVVVLQGLFPTERCAEIPELARPGFLCGEDGRGYGPVPLLLLGARYQVACHPGRPEACLAVHRRVGRLRGELEGEPLDGCGEGARVAWGQIARERGPDLRVVSVQGSDGLSEEAQDCRLQQLEQISEAMDGRIQLVLGGAGTDPHRFAAVDESARRWGELRLLSGRAPTYRDLATLDLQASDAYEASCFVPDTPELLDAVYFDHRPVVCQLTR
jgi:hypothetical protein